MKKWKILNKFIIHPPAGGSEFKVNKLIKILLANRGIKTKKETEEFLDPKLDSVTPQSVGIDKKQLGKAVGRIKKAIENKEQIVVFGDYDVDGISGTAILWETLRDLKGNALPYIPHRIDEGYGLSVKAIQSSEFKVLNPKLIITVDNGIVAGEAVELAKEQGIDVIITDHHSLPPHSGLSPSGLKTGGSKKLPKAYAIVHTTKLCGTAVAYLLSQEIKNQKSKIKNQEDEHLELVALATVADLVPLKAANRTLLKYGLEKLRKTKRVGLLALFAEAAIDKTSIDTYEIGHIIAPRLNAMGRIEHAMESLRLLCTNNSERARSLAHRLTSTNRQRQLITEETVLHARSEVRSRKSKVGKLIFVSHKSYQPGVIGLVAGKLVEEFYRPAIVVSKGKKYSKASARSISGFNIIEFIRMASDLLVDAGGHPMAAGFTVETEKLVYLQEALEKKAESLVDENLLTKTLSIDCELPLSFVTDNVYNAIQQLLPFGMGNPQPLFVSRNVVIDDMRLVGGEGKHLKLRFSPAQPRGSTRLAARQAHENFLGGIDGIGFGLGERATGFRIGDTVDIVYAIDEDTWNGNKKIQLKIKDIK